MSFVTINKFSDNPAQLTIFKRNQDYFLSYSIDKLDENTAAKAKSILNYNFNEKINTFDDVCKFLNENEKIALSYDVVGAMYVLISYELINHHYPKDISLSLDILSKNNISDFILFRLNLYLFKIIFFKRLILNTAKMMIY